MESDLELNSKGIPSIIDFLMPLITSTSKQDIKFLMTLLMVTRSLKPRKKEDIPYSLSTITDPFTGKSTKLDPNVLRIVMEKMKLPKLSIHNFRVEDLILINKAGPHGPSTLSILKSLRLFD